MDPIADYLAAAYPEPVTLLGQRLRPFSLGHMELLARFRNAYVSNASAPTLDDLSFGVFVCCQGWREAQESLEAIDLFERLKKWGCKLPPFEFEEKSEAFVSYLLAGCKQPQLIQREESGGPGTGVTLIHDVRLVLCGELGYSRESAMDTPWGLALWDYYGHHARNGTIQIVGRELADHLEWAKGVNQQLLEARRSN